VALQPAGKVEFQKHDMHLPGREPGRPDQLVDIDWAWTKRADDPLALALNDVGEGRRRATLIGRGKLGPKVPPGGRGSVRAPRRYRRRT
jgi:hypothetical protein